MSAGNYDWCSQVGGLTDFFLQSSLCLSSFRIRDLAPQPAQV
jgi:hypothetical protein